MTLIPQVAETETRFHITGRTAIQFMLLGFAREREPFTVQFKGGEESFLSTLLAVDKDDGLLIFDCSGSSETNRQLLASERALFAGRPGGIPVQFSSGPIREINYEGAKAFAVELPAFLVRLQRRENFRVETPRVKPLVFFGRLPSGELLKLPANDLSVSGIGLNADSEPLDLAIDMVLQNCHFALPGETQELFVEATIRRILPRETRSGNRYWQVGLQFNDLSSANENRIQRYIDRLERERRELS